MKRYNGLHDKLCTIENIEVADDNVNTLMLKIFFIKFKVLQALDILIGMVKELILLNIMVNMLE